jgi:tetratricopeptide (TPR) repeat protein
VAVRLHITHIREFDHLLALEYGRVDEGQPTAWWCPVGEPVGAGDTGPLMGYLHDGAHGRAVGFKVIGVSQLDVDAPDVREIWGRPRFDAPVLGLSHVSAGQIIVAARALFGGRTSISHELFARAAAASGEEALGLWLASLEAGESAAHWYVGRALYNLGRYHEAYRHLRYYTEIAPALSWTWSAYGQAAEALGLDGEARAGYRRAVDLERSEGETGAAELLVDLEARMPRRRRRGWWPDR